MEFVDFFLNPQSEEEFEIINTESGKTNTQIPFFEGGMNYRSTLIRALEMTGDEQAQFNPQRFNEAEKKWLKKVQIINQEGTEFNSFTTFLPNLGQQLYNSLFPKGKTSEDIIKNAQQRANIGKEGLEDELHLQFRFEPQYKEENEPESVINNFIADYPWELIHDGNKFLAWYKVSFSRYIAYKDNPPNLKPVGKINVLLISPQTFDYNDSKRKAIRKGLEKAKTEGHINLIDLADLVKGRPTFEALQNYLTQQESQTHVLHFDGHGLYGKKCTSCGKVNQGFKPQQCSNCGKVLSQEAQGYLEFENEQGQPDYISGEKLGTTLQNFNATQNQQQEKLALVVLSACQSGMALAGSSAFNGAAQKLIQHRIPAVVAMQYSVSIKAATKFAEQFYRALGQKQPLSAAMRQARIKMDIESNQWYRPVLYLRWNDHQGGQLFDLSLSEQQASLSDKKVCQKGDNLKSPPISEELSFAQRLQKESLQAELAARKKDYEDVVPKYNREQNPALKNSWKDQLDECLKDIDRIEKDIKKLDKCHEDEIIVELFNILNNHFDEYKNTILQAYRLSLPSRLRDEIEPLNTDSLIKELQLFPKQEPYSYLEKFVVLLLLLLSSDSKISIELNQIERNETIKVCQELQVWAQKNIKNYQQLLIELKQEQKEKNKQCNPCLMLAISKSGSSYVVEAWLIKNLVQYNRNNQEYDLDCEQLKINQKSLIKTDEKLSNLPQLVIKLIAQSLNKCQKSLQQIHIFLPCELMNHPVDSWQTEEEKEKDYIITIGEYSEVLLRCSERLRGKSPKFFKWCEKAKILKNNLHQPSVNFLTLGNSKNPQILFEKVKKEDVIAVEIINVFQKEQPGTLLWKGSIPLALWIRKTLPNIDKELDNLLRKNQQKDLQRNKISVKQSIFTRIPHLIGRLLNRKSHIPLKEIPCQVKKKRGENHLISKHLCLLWDDPDLLPPEQFLTHSNL